MKSVAEQAIDAARPFLGLATEDVLRRSAKGLVGSDFDALGEEHLSSLAYWVRIAVLRLELLDETSALALADAIVGLSGGERFTAVPR